MATAAAIVFLKVVRSGHYPTPLDEAERMRWARPYLPVPEVIDAGSDGTVDWIITAALEGLDATLHPLKADPVRLVPILARGLAAFHAAAPVDGVPVRLSRARRDRRTYTNAFVRGIVKPDDLHPEHAHLSIDAAVAELERLAPDSEDLVVCHGDYCFPNVLIDRHGAVTGYIDLGELAVADRWWDVARRRVEHDLERRARLGRPLLRVVRRRTRRAAHPVLPAPLRPRVLIRPLPTCAGRTAVAPP